ncbi:MAG: biotin--[acetyl-CoA-carboxylase] ligase [Paludibacteraceae bacterium]
MYIEETDSTNNLLKAAVVAEAAWLREERIPVVWTGFQTAGRGQAGNGWESERGQNLLFSVLLRKPQVAIAEQFMLSMLAAVVLRETVAEEIGNEGLTIKWPNDLYWGDKKLAGMLIENTLAGREIAYSIIGIGLNINQEHWIGNAPNPVSMRLITGQSYSTEKILTRYMVHLQAWLQRPQSEWREAYMQHLYRREGWWRFIEREVSLTPTMNAEAKDGGFLARIEGITPEGELLLEHADGTHKAYHFKEIRYILDPLNLP